MLKHHLAKLFLTGLAFLMIMKAYGGDLSGAKNIKDACVAGAMLDASGIPYKVVVFTSPTESEAGCIYQVNGASYLYTPAGSAKINPAQVAKVPLERVSRNDVFKICDGDREIRNGCLVYATCAYTGYKRDSHILWGGIIAAQVININNYGAENDLAGVSGHAITAYENDRKEIFIQENGEEPKKLDHMTELAQAGNTSWHDSSALIYCDRHIQGITAFKDEFGRPR